MKKAILVAVVLLVALPFLPRLMPKPLTMERVERAYSVEGARASDARKVEPPGLEAVEQLSMTVSGAQVDVYRYDNEGKLAKQMEYQKPDAGSVIVEAWNLSESLGAAKPKSKPVSVARRGMFMMTATSEDAALRERIIKIFKSL